MDIKVKDIEKPAEDKSVQLPQNYIQVGETINDRVVVYIKQEVFKEITAFAKSDIRVETGSILLGDYSESMGKLHVIISAFIKAEYTDSTNSTLTFTHETWEDVHLKKDKFHSDKKIIGWQHTHPGYGIFLSNYDVFIQQNFFNLPYQIAYVIDPIANKEGFFYNGANKPELLGGYNIYDDIGKKIIVKNEIAKPKLEYKSKKKEQVLGGPIILSLVHRGTL